MNCTQSSFLNAPRKTPDNLLYTDRQEMLVKILSLDVEIKNLQPKRVHIYSSDLKNLSTVFDEIYDKNQATFDFGNQKYRCESNSNFITFKNNAGEALITFDQCEYKKVRERISALIPTKESVKRSFLKTGWGEELTREESGPDSITDEELGGLITSININSAACKLFDGDPEEVNRWLENKNKRAKINCESYQRK